ncbi:MAG: SH3 domain-containing protein [Peptoniphilus sp.]|nr:SH3 domain-containing protein [Peptoniphilus sp.]
MNNNEKRNYILKYKKQIRLFLLLLVLSLLTNIWLFAQNMKYKSDLAQMSAKYEEAEARAKNPQLDPETTAKIESLESEIQRLRLQNEDLENSASKRKNSGYAQLSQEYGDFRIKVDGVNVRATPGLDGEIVDQFNEGYIFTVYDSKKSGDTLWYGFYLNNDDTQYSWVSSSLVEPFEP